MGTTILHRLSIRRRGTHTSVQSTRTTIHTQTLCGAVYAEDAVHAVCDRAPHLDNTHRSITDGVRWTSSPLCEAVYSVDGVNVPCMLRAHTDARHVNTTQGIRWS